MAKPNNKQPTSRGPRELAEISAEYVQLCQHMGEACVRKAQAEKVIAGLSLRVEQLEVEHNAALEAAAKKEPAAAEKPLVML